MAEITSRRTGELLCRGRTLETHRELPDHAPVDQPGLRCKFQHHALRSG